MGTTTSPSRPTGQGLLPPTTAMEGDFDFLKYLDFNSNGSGSGVSQFHSLEEALSDDLSYSGTADHSSSSNNSTFASPQDFTFSDYTSSNYGGEGNSPPALFGGA